jgi:hypothetical protein
MRQGILITAFSLLTAASQAATLISTNVDALTLGCAFNTNCTNIVEVDVSPITLPGATGTAFLETRVIRGERGAPAAGLSGYLYRLDLTGITPSQTNQQPCFTNVTRCFTNVVVGFTNVVTCRTNPGGAFVFCSTNVFPASNVVFCVTNFVPATNFVRCVTTSSGELICFTNTFPATNLVMCFTNRVPERRQIVCQTNQFGTTNFIVCATNQVRVLSNVVMCTTNTLPCAEVTSCVDAITIPFGRVVSHEGFSPVRSNGVQVLVVSNSLGTVTPVAVEQNGPLVTIRFSPPLCAGDSSVYVGLLSTERPRETRVRLALLSGATIQVNALGPRVDEDEIRCDFDELEDLIKDLPSQSFVGPNEASREALRRAILSLVDEAEDAARDRDWDFVIEALFFISARTDADSDDWITGNAAIRTQGVLSDLLDCLGRGDQDGDDDHGKHGKKDKDRDDKHENNRDKHEDKHDDNGRGRGNRD